MCLSEVYLDACQTVGSIYSSGLTEEWGQVLLLNLSTYKLYAFPGQQQMLFSGEKKKKKRSQKVLDSRGNQIVITDYLKIVTMKIMHSKNYGIWQKL